ncbi:Protein ROOT INITIATION DEFECTIVE 3 [Linum perenne]
MDRKVSKSKQREEEALILCGGKNMGTGIDVWNLDSGDRILHIPTCASPSYGLSCLRGQVLIASQANKHGSVGGGAIFSWYLNKPHSPIRSYQIEAIGPLACTFNGMYLVGGALSGNAYIWEVTSGRLVKTWRAHHRSFKCIAFTNDDSVLISGSDDGTILAWSLISLLDVEDVGSSSSLLHFSMEHKSSITSLLMPSGSTNSCFISTSLDATCKVWELVSGSLIQTREYPTGIAAATLHPTDRLLVTGSCIDGRIFVNELDLGLIDEPIAGLEQHMGVLKGHNGSITALTFSRYGLISASEDCTVCLWDVGAKEILWRINHQKGPVTNLVVVLHSSLISTTNHHQRVSSRFCVSSLDKCPQPDDPSKGEIAFLPSCFYPNDVGQSTALDLSTSDSLDRQILEMMQEKTPESMGMKIEMKIGQQMWALRMTKHVMEMNKHLQCRLLDLMQTRLLLAWNKSSFGATSKKNEKKKKKKKKVKIESKYPSEED